MESINWVGTAITFIAAFGGVAVGYGIIKTQVSSNKEDIKTLWQRYGTIMGENGKEPLFVRDRDCTRRVDAMGNSIASIVEKVVEQGKSIKGIQNFARHWMQREGMTIVEINRIINGGN